MLLRIYSLLVLSLAATLISRGATVEHDVLCEP